MEIFFVIESKLNSGFQLYIKVKNQQGQELDPIIYAYNGDTRRPPRFPFLPVE